MNYLKHYYLLIAKTCDRNYNETIHELHHIIPSVINGPDHLLNIAYLTYREHKFAHRLLRKVMPSRTHESIQPIEGQSRAYQLYKLKRKAIEKKPPKPRKTNAEYQKEYRERQKKLH